MPNSPICRSVAWTALFCCVCTTQAEVLANQVGWPPVSHKTVLLTAGSQVPVGTAWTLTKTGASAVAGAGKVGAAQGWGPMGNDGAQVVVLPDSLEAGSYQFASGSVQASFQVVPDAWMPVAKGLLKTFYYQRAGFELTSTYAGAYSRPATHVDGYASYDPSTGRSTGGKNSPKGWYDAGDYNKYVVNSGITTWALLALYEQFKPFMDTLKWGIPEENQGRAALLAEARWNLDWMLTMQDDDGGVFHKWTQKKFDDFEMPQKDASPRFFVGKSVTASYDFAAVMAKASRLYSYDAVFSSSALEASKRAWTWAEAHPNAQFRNPAGIGTGEYGDTSAVDERFWASIELGIATGDASYQKVSDPAVTLPWWSDVGMLGQYEIVSHPDRFTPEKVAKAQAAILVLADRYVQRVQTGPWAAPQQEGVEFPWGSNSVLAHMGIQMVYAYLATGKAAYLEGADVALDHLLGRNPLGLCTVTGFGSKSARHIHHRISASDGVEAPVPGMLVGGAYGGGDDAPWSTTENWKCHEYRVGGKVALDWLDDQCSYATNEIAINWNAAGAFLATSLSALHQRSSQAPVWRNAGVRSKAPGQWEQGRLRLDVASQLELRTLDGTRVWASEGRAGQWLEVPRHAGIQILTVRGRDGSTVAWKLSSIR